MLYNSLNEINPDVDSKKLIFKLDELLTTLRKNPQNYSRKDALRLEIPFRFYLNYPIDDPISYRYHIDVFSSLCDDKPYDGYFNMLYQLGDCEKYYFRKDLVEDNSSKVYTYSKPS